MACGKTTKVDDMYTFKLNYTSLLQFSAWHGYSSHSLHCHLYPLQCAVEDYELIGPPQYKGKDNTTSDSSIFFPLINVHHFPAHVKEEDWRTLYVDIWDSMVSRHILYKLFSNAHIFDDTANMSVTFYWCFRMDSSELLSSVHSVCTIAHIINYDITTSSCHGWTWWIPDLGKGRTCTML